MAIISAPRNVEATGAVVVQVPSARLSTAVGLVAIRPPMKPAGNASLPPMEFAMKAANIGIANPNSVPPKSAHRLANLSSERLKPS